ncbi:MAG: organic hydroperoxide resistance protein [Solirubrobacteraceae bacterium]
MARAIYTARAHVTGGREHGHGRTDDGRLEVDLRPPGQDAGTNPEQLFAVGYASCFGSAMTVVARRLKLDVSDHEIDSAVELWPTEERGFRLAVALDVRTPSIADQARAEELVRAAHRVCPYSNATRGNVDVALTVNGRPLT